MSFNLTHYLKRRVNEHPDRLALVIPVMEGDNCLREEQVTYRELAHRIAACQVGWRNAGLVKGDRVILLFRPCIDLYAMVVSLISLGIVPVFIDTGMPRDKIMMAMQDANAKAIVSLSALISKFWMIPALWKMQRYAVDGEGVGYRAAQTLFLETAAQDFDIVEVGAQDHGLISFTSGSTGRPKGADRTHFSLKHQHLAIRDHLPDREGDIDMTSFPVWVLHNLCCGMTTILPKVDLAAPGNVNPQVILEQLIQYHVTRVSAAPAFMMRFTEYLVKQSVQLPYINLAFTGGAPVNAQLAENMVKAFPNATVEIVYGSTEAEPISSIHAHDFIADEQEHDGYLVGKPVNEIEVCVATLPSCPVSEAQVEAAKVPPYQVGEILVSGQHVLQAYVDNIEATRENKVTRSSGLVWHRTGDTGFFDSKGRIWLTGRAKDVIDLGDQQLQPFPVEARLDAIAGIERAAIVQEKGQIFLFVETALDFSPLAAVIQPILRELGISEIKLATIDKIPMDARHNSKINRPLLRDQIVTSKAKLLGLITADSAVPESTKDHKDATSSDTIGTGNQPIAKASDTPSNFIMRLNWVDYVTLTSVVTTWLSIMLSLNGMLHLAMAVLFLAMLTDAFDGILARKFGLERNFGRYLDGFMDVLIYLVSPSIILYLSGFNGLYSLIIMLFIAFGCIRLSVFNDIGNIQESDGLSYLGMPVFWSIPLVGLHQLLIQFLNTTAVNFLLAIGMLAFCYCMVIRKPFFKFTSLVQILSVTLGGFTVFLSLQFAASIETSLFYVVTVALYLQWPIIVGGVLHMVVVAKDMFKFLKIPINTPLFGANKTLRGFVVVPIFTVLGFWLLWPIEQWLVSNGMQPIVSQHNLFLIGAVSGFLYVLAELPNSFLKRRMGAAPGETPQRFKMGFVLFDQIDSALFIALGYGLIFGYHWTVCLAAFIFAPLVALSVKRVLFAAKLKKTAT